MRELTSWEIFQIEKWGNILEVPDMEIEEPGELRGDTDEVRKWEQMEDSIIEKQY